MLLYLSVVVNFIYNKGYNRIYLSNQYIYTTVNLHVMSIQNHNSAVKWQDINVDYVAGNVPEKEVVSKLNQTGRSNLYSLFFHKVKYLNLHFHKCLYKFFNVNF